MRTKQILARQGSRNVALPARTAPSPSSPFLQTRSAPYFGKEGKEWGGGGCETMDSRRACMHTLVSRTYRQAINPSRHKLRGVVVCAAVFYARSFQISREKCSHNCYLWLYWAWHAACHVLAAEQAGRSRSSMRPWRSRPTGSDPTGTSSRKRAGGPPRATAEVRAGEVRGELTKRKDDVE